MLSITNELDLNVDYGLHVIKFWATWCPPCRALAPTVDKLDDEFDNIKFTSVDVDQVPRLAQKYKVKTLPTLLLIKDGEEVNRICGMSLIAPLRKALKSLEGIEEEDIIVPDAESASG